tara:strand:- start:60 stop:416 length:357 start_codon:yes stop_codon:yes gene_type:complete
MKLTKTQLKRIIKEEIQDVLTVMDDPFDDDAVPPSMERDGSMDQLAKEIERQVTLEMEEAILIITNHLITRAPDGDIDRLAAEGMAILHDLGFRGVSESQALQMLDDKVASEYLENRI